MRCSVRRGLRSAGRAEGAAIGLWVTLGVVAAVAALVVLLYNRLVRARTRVDQAWAQVATQLQRRHDLIPNLVATVGAYARHEEQALRAVTRARADALGVQDPDARAEAEDHLGAALHQLLAVAESYPDLKADERFAHLQRELSDTEDRLAFARGFANDRVRRYHELTDTFPSNLVAGWLGFEHARSFAVEDDLARAAPTVELDH